MEVFLILNGREIRASVEEQERLMLGVASGSRDRQQLGAWLWAHSFG
jgi:death-on-curing protein